MATTFSLIVLCLVSHPAEWIHESAGSLFKGLTNLSGFLLVVLLAVAETVKWFLRDGGWRSMTRLRNQLARLWRLSFFQSFPTGRARSGGHRPNASTQSSELDDMRPVYTPYGNRDQGDNERYEDIDNVI